MTEYPERKNHRLKDYDYGSAGYYFVTVCTHKKMKLLSTVGSAALGAPCSIRLTKLGKRVAECWYRMEQLDENVRIDKVIFMPNHIHAIIELTNPDWQQIREKEYDFEIAERRGRRSLQGLLHDFKSVTTRIYKRDFGGESSLWQDSFYETVLRSQRRYEKAWQYIDDNPAKWQEDELYIE